MVHMHDFLRKTKQLLSAIETAQCVHVILGNESCDLDSMVSTIVLALFYANRRYKFSDIKVVPVLNCKSDEFVLRTENIFLLQKYQLNQKDLIFRDNINLTTLQDNEMLKITLVDHHVLTGDDIKLAPCVQEIFDHRPRDESVTWSSDVHLVIQQVGSCCSLIAKEVLAVYANCLCTAAGLLYETIVFDTIGFKTEAGKATELDYQMADRLEKILKITRPRDNLFEELWEAHNNVGALTPKQLLSKDLKVIDAIYIPGLPMLVQKYLERPDVAEALAEFTTEKEAALLILMGLETEDGLQRDLAIYALQQSPLLECIKKALLKADLGLQEQQVDFENITCYKQNNTKHSRKKVMPIIKECVEQNKIDSV